MNNDIEFWESPDNDADLNEINKCEIINRTPTLVSKNLI